MARQINKGSTTQRGYGTQHQKWRKAILKRDIRCACKGQPGCNHLQGYCPYPSTEADHIDSNTFNRSMSNGQGMCTQCHKNKTRLNQTNKPSQACTADGIPIDKRHHWN